MLIGLIVALVLVNAGWLILMDRRDARDRAERAVLHQRFQAPQAAVAEHHAQVMPAPEPAGSPLPMSDAEMAEMMAAPDEQASVRAWIARMEAAENGTGQIEDGVLP